MKATQQQYEECVKIYEDHGAPGVYAYANEISITDWSECHGCETETPDCDDGTCLVCGLVKPIANATLIAAAPEMLRILETIHANAAESPEWIRHRTSAAIAKATGETR